MQPKGDKVQVVTNVVTEDGTEQETFGEEFVIEKDGGEITELPLSGKKYQYVFAATDIFGNTFYSDMATFEMIMSYDELLKNPRSSSRTINDLWFFLPLSLFLMY